MSKLILSTVFFILASVAIGQLPPPPSSSRPVRGTSRSNGWRSVNSLPAQPGFVSLEGRFRIGFPKDVQGFGAVSPKQTGTTASGQQFTWKFAEAEVVGFFLDFPDSQLTGSVEEVSQITANSKKLVSERMPGAKLLSEAATAVNGVRGSYLIYDLGPDGFISVHFFLDKKRLYRFNATFKERAVDEILNSVFKSFELITQDEVNSEVQLKYERMKPSLLPQSPVVAKLTSDAQDEGLKGKVRKVITESEDQSGTWSVQGRKFSSVAYYDQNGALTQRDSYDSQGNPFQITVYGYIDGKRVSNSKMTSYEYDPPPAVVPSGALNAKSSLKKDQRYEYSFEYRYENGKLAEKQMLFNDGRKGMRYVYKRTSSQVDELVYSEDGDLNQRYLSVIDTNGNEIERTDFGLANFKIYGDRKYKSSYELDENGNWIKQTNWKAVLENGSQNWQTYSVYYRTIVYY